MSGNIPIKDDLILTRGADLGQPGLINVQQQLHSLVRLVGGLMTERPITQSPDSLFRTCNGSV